MTIGIVLEIDLTNPMVKLHYMVLAKNEVGCNVSWCKIELISSKDRKSIEFFFSFSWKSLVLKENIQQSFLGKTVLF